MSAQGPVSDRDRFAILLATYNGARWLDAQLHSLAAQDRARIDVTVSDDGSTDGTGALLAEWARRWRKGRFEVVSGPGRGFAENFRFLLGRDVGDATYVAFCDQDDLWLPGKLGIAAAALREFGERPALFCSRTELMDESGSMTGHSPAFPRPPGFANALVQSIAGGNTMVLNRAAFRLVSEAAGRAAFVSHDWFCYLMVSGAGGEVVFSHEPLVRYRQHASNLVGANIGWRARLERLTAALGGRFTRWNDVNLAALDRCQNLLTEDARLQLDRFKAAREGSLPQRLAALRRSGVYRQTASGQVSLWLAALLGKL